MKKSLLMLLLLATSVSASEEPQTISFKCVFDKIGTSTGVESEDFKLDFVIDTSTGAAYMVGNNGSSKVRLVKNNSGITFIEITGTGNVMTTSFVNNDDIKMDAVHSRNTIMGKSLIPSQYYGSCSYGYY